jgi:hypothetical protein
MDPLKFLADLEHRSVSIAVKPEIGSVKLVIHLDGSEVAHTLILNRDGTWHLNSTRP